jgi:hypothetical protein
MKKFYLIAQITAILLIITFFACHKESPSDNSIIGQRIKQSSKYDLSAFLLDKITENRIVMLGDHEHGQGLYSRPVIDFLNYWLDNIEQNRDQEIPQRITLFLEHDSLTNQRLYRFFYTGNLINFIEPEDFVVSFSVDKVEFIYDLRDIHYRVKELNDTVSYEHKVHFQITGPEKIPILTEDSPEKQAVFSIEERDKYSADQICRFLEAHPDHRAFIFYGAAHLFRKGYPTSHPGR